VLGAVIIVTALTRSVTFLLQLSVLKWIRQRSTGRYDPLGSQTYQTKYPWLRPRVFFNLRNSNLTMA